MVNSIFIVGSSMAMRGSGCGFSASVMVSPISKSSSPTIAQIITALHFLYARTPQSLEHVQLLDAGALYTFVALAQGDGVPPL